MKREKGRGTENSALQYALVSPQCTTYTSAYFMYSLLTIGAYLKKGDNAIIDTL